MADAARAIRRNQRNLDRRVARTLRRVRNRKNRRNAGDYEPVRVDFSCVYLCGACDYFVHEHQGDDGAVVACPACGESDWIDLAVEPLANRIRDMEAEERMKVPQHVRRLVLGVSLGFFGVLATGFAVAYIFFGGLYGGFSFLTVLAAAILVPIINFWLPRPAAVFLLRNQERVPHRWHVPMPLPDPDEPPSRKYKALQAQPISETLKAPISGRECMAYQVCVLFDTPGDARPPEWVLQEQEAVAVRLGEELEVPAKALYLESPVAEVQVIEDAGEKYEAVKRFLRQRGLFITDGEFHYFEARLEPGDEVDVSDHDEEMYVVRHSGAVDCGTLPGLPRPTWRD